LILMTVPHLRSGASRRGACGMTAALKEFD
jgi:hypothetical protein